MGYPKWVRDQMEAEAKAQSAEPEQVAEPEPTTAEPEATAAEPEATAEEPVQDNPKRRRRRATG